MVEVTYQMVLSTLQTAGLLVGIIYYIAIMRNAQRTRELTLKAQEHATETRQTQLFMQIYQQLNSEATHKSWIDLVNLEINDFEEYLQKYDSSVNPDHYAKRAHIWYTYSSIGELLRQGFIDPDLLERLAIDTMVMLLWENWEHIIRETRVRDSIPDLWEGFEYLYDEMKSLRDRKGYPDPIVPKST